VNTEWGKKQLLKWCLWVKRKHEYRL
jgi:hypothetical protein